jgi:hypothetical protein
LFEAEKMDESRAMEDDGITEDCPCPGRKEGFNPRAAKAQAA